MLCPNGIVAILSSQQSIHISGDNNDFRTSTTMWPLTKQKTVFIPPKTWCFYGYWLLKAVQGLSCCSSSPLSVLAIKTSENQLWPTTLNLSASFSILLFAWLYPNKNVFLAVERTNLSHCYVHKCLLLIMWVCSWKGREWNARNSITDINVHFCFLCLLLFQCDRDVDKTITSIFFIDF